MKNGILGVDLGCGIGQNVDLLSPLAQVCIGIDLSLKLLHQAKLRYSHLIQADVQAIPFRGEIFDLGLCIAVLHHVLGRDARQQAVVEMKRIMTTGGTLLISVWRRWQYRFRKIFLQEGFRNAALYFPAGTREFGDIDIGWTDSTTHQRSPRLYHLFTQSEMRDLLKVFHIMLVKLAGHQESKDNYLACVTKER
ncbi:MAG: hypothetical protein RBG13Loki_2502 [Promethearchaeota archaeon CR_4]|nr:MAG: hypothetical protein RBG13Loki_2502 [Candidatus Lokiarchaeota archaeon CR_4]